MSLFEGIIAFAVVLVGYYISRKFEDKGKEVSDLKEELRQAKKELEYKTSSQEWLQESYEDLIKKYEMLLGRYNPPPRWWESEESNCESLEAEEEQEYEDDEDEQMVEIFVKGKDGTRKEKVPAKYVNFKRRNK